VTPLIKGQQVKGQSYQTDKCRDKKISHIFGAGRPSYFKLGTRMQNEDPHWHARQAMTSKL